MRVLHVIHDFLPKHQAGSEIYAASLCQALAQRGLEVDVLCADYDLALRHGTIRWRFYGDLRVAELINNWAFSSFAETYDSPTLNRQLRNILETIRPDVLHIHNLLNLSFALPAIAREMGIPSVATLHEYTLPCPSGGQRVHEAERHICTVIDPDRCARCFPQHNFHGRLVFGQLAVRRASSLKRVARLADVVRRRAPRVFGAMTRALQSVPATAGQISSADITRRLEHVHRVFDTIDLFVAPSPNLGAEYRRLGLPADKLRVSDYGFVPLHKLPKASSDGRLRIGFVGTLVWHKGMHVLLEALRKLPADSFELRVFGDTTTFPDYVATLQGLSRGLPVRFMGRFERGNVASVYANMDVLVVPSLWPENSPLVIHEAFQAGVPVVGSRAGGTQDLVTHERDGLLYEPFSSTELAAALLSLINDRDRLRRLALAAPPVKTVEQDASEMIDAYHEVLSRRRATASVPQQVSVSDAARRASAYAGGSKVSAAAAGGTVAVFLNYRTPEDTILAVRSLQASHSPLAGVIVVDNASGDDSVQKLRQRLPDAHVICCDTNGGFSAGTNAGIREALRRGADRVLLLNSDVVVPPDALGHLEAALDQDATLGIVGPVLVSRADPESVESCGISYSIASGRMRHRGARTRRSSHAAFDSRDAAGVSGCAMLIRREVLEKIGLLAEEFFFGFEDLDFCLRAREHGYRTACVGRAVVLHEGSLSIGLGSARRIYFTTRNHLLLARRLSVRQSRLAHAFQVGSIAALNLAHVLLTSGVPRHHGLSGYVRGLQDHFAGRYGAGPLDVGAPARRAPAAVAAGAER